MNLLRMTLLLLLSTNFFGCERSETDVLNEEKVQKLASADLKKATQADLDIISEDLVVKYHVLTNIPSEKCDKNIADGACFEVELSFTAKRKVMANEWSIYFSQIAPIQSVDSDEFSIEHINGDLHRISLKKAFSGFEQGETKRLIFRAMYWSLSETDALPNYIVNANHLKPRVIESTQPVIDAETGLEVLPYVVPFTDYEKQFKRTELDLTQWADSRSIFERNVLLGENKIPVSQVIIPTPKSVIVDPKGRQLNLSKGIKVTLNNVERNEINTALSRLNTLGIRESEKGIALSLSVSADHDKMLGSYKLSIEENSIEIVGVDTAGAFNGLQSLASLVTLDKSEIPLLTIIDEPHYEFRGLLIDVARNFHSKAFILSLLEQMAAYKLNKLHLHLGDDEGWRLEIPSLPELTEVGSVRCFDLADEACLAPQLGAGINQESPVNGFYSVADYQEILKAASARHIQVIPSLDMPGHSRAAIKAMTVRAKRLAIAEHENAQQFNLYEAKDPTIYSSVQFYNDNTMNVCLESSYDFVTEVMMQVKKIHAEAGQPLTRYHIGADETAGAWVESQACKDFVANNDKGVKSMSELGAYFIERVAGILSDLDIETAGWSDGLSHTRKENMPALVQSNAWDVLSWKGHNKVHEQTNRDWQVVISTPDALYFDFPYEADPKEHGYYWASRHTNTEKVFQFMPDNLPIHAEFWADRQELPYESDDTKTPLAKNKRYFGIQGQLWSENTRTDHTAQYKLFPRLFALAERAWHLADWAVPYNYSGAVYSRKSKVFSDKLKAQRDEQWRTFANTIGQKALPKLEREQVFYRLPTVGAIIENGQLKANIAFPGLSIEYKLANKPWTTYVSQVAVNGDVSVRAMSFDGKRKGRSLPVKYH